MRSLLLTALCSTLIAVGVTFKGGDPRRGKQPKLSEVVFHITKLISRKKNEAPWKSSHPQSADAAPISTVLRLDAIWSHAVPLRHGLVSPASPPHPGTEMTGDLT